MSVINTNVKALFAQESLRSNNLKLSASMERLATGLRINSSKDDAAGLAISNRMTAQVRGLSMAIKNANDGVSMAQTADGAYGQVTSMLQRMRELAVQAANGTMTTLDRESIQLEIEELKMEIDNVATKTHFNDIKLLDGSATNLTLQTGAFEGDQPSGVAVGIDGSLWVGTERGLFLRRVGRRDFQRVAGPAFLEGSAVRRLWPAADGGLWVDS